MTTGICAESCGLLNVKKKMQGWVCQLTAIFFIIHCLSPTPAEAVADIATEDTQIFTVLDAMKGYYQCLLEESSQSLTTFITPFGHFRYLCAPYGLSSIAEHYNRLMAEAFEGLIRF